MSFPSPPRAITALLLLSSLLLGLAQAALMPPFEGFDEIGHYSYLQQVAETGRWPRLGDRMSKDIDDYLQIAPTSELAGPAWTYFRFFSAPRDVVSRARETLHAPQSPSRSFAFGKVANWQGQHPPLYYYALAPVYLATKNLSFLNQLFVLRACSYALAWLALCIVLIMASPRWLPPSLAAPMVLAASAWPLIFPMWFPEMARVGNDSLITIWAALVGLLAWSVTTSTNIRDHMLLGLVLGLALLTKATFLPAAAAIFIVLSVLALFAGKPGELAQRLKGICVTAAILLAVCGWWYVQKLIETGSVIGSNDAVQMQAVGGLVAGLNKNLRIEDVLMWPWAFVASFLWAGTWSFVLPPRIYMVPLVIAIVALAFGAWRTMRRAGAQPIDWFVLLFLLLFAAALTYQALVLRAIGAGYAPAWYLHSFAPILALFVGYGIIAIANVRWARGVTAALLLYPLLLFFPGVLLLNSLYFAGCAPMLPGRHYFARSSGFECLADFSRMYDNLSVIVLPGIGIGLFVVGWFIAVIAMLMTMRWLASRLELA